MHRIRLFSFIGGGIIALICATNTFSAVIDTSSVNTTTDWSSQRKLVRTSDDKLYAVYQKYGDIYLAYSTNNGQTWQGHIAIATQSGMGGLQYKPSIAVDIDDCLHVVWHGSSTIKGYSYYQIWYSSYNGTVVNNPLRISTEPGMDSYDQTRASIVCDSRDNLIVIWSGKATGYASNEQIWSAHYEEEDEIWDGIERISIGTNMENYPQGMPAVSFDKDNNPNVVWSGKGNTFTTNDQIWFSSRTATAWTTPYRLSNASNMNANAQFNPCIAIDNNKRIFVAWSGAALGDTNTQIYAQRFVNSWNAAVRISSAPVMASFIQASPSIAIDTNNNPHVLWHTNASGQYEIWHGSYTTVWHMPKKEMLASPPFQSITLRYSLHHLNGGNLDYVCEQGAVDPFSVVYASCAYNLSTYSPDPDTWQSKSGTFNWSMGSAWDKGSAPPAGAIVMISSGSIINLDISVNPRILWVREGGILQPNVGTYTVNIGSKNGNGTIEVEGTFRGIWGGNYLNVNITTGSVYVEFNGMGDFRDFYIQPGATAYIDTDITVYKMVIYDGGVLNDTKGHNISLYNNWEQYGKAKYFTANTSSATFIGNLGCGINSFAGCSIIDFQNVIINKSNLMSVSFSSNTYINGDIVVSSGFANMNGNITVFKRDLIINGGIFNGPMNKEVELQRNIEYSTGTFNMNDSTLTITGNFDQHINCYKAITVKGLKVNKTGGVMDLNNNITILKNAFFKDGTFNAGDNIITVKGDFIIDGGVFHGDTSEVIMGDDGTGFDRHMYSFQNSEFNNLTIKRDYMWAKTYVHNNIDIHGLLTVATGYLYLGDDYVHVMNDARVEDNGTLYLQKSTNTFEGSVTIASGTLYMKGGNWELHDDYALLEIGNALYASPSSMIYTSSSCAIIGVADSTFTFMMRGTFDLDECYFRKSKMYWDASTILFNKFQKIQFYDCATAITILNSFGTWKSLSEVMFDSCAVNVSYTMAGSSITFFNCMGDSTGDDFDNDPLNQVHWKDTYMPEHITDLKAYTDSQIRLEWTAPYDPPDWMDNAPVTGYVVKVSTITGFYSDWDFNNKGTTYYQTWVPKNPGEKEIHYLTGLYPAVTYYISIKSYDEDNNVSMFYTSSTVNGVGSSSFILGWVSISSDSTKSVAWGDYDNDTYLDFIEANFGAGEDAIVYHNNGNGTFTDYEIPSTQMCNDAQWGDYNNDGLLDFALVSNISPYVQVFRNNGGNSFNMQYQYTTDFGQTSCVWTDTDNDGDQDLVVVGSALTARLFRNDGSDTWTTIGISVPGNLRDVVAADVDFNGQMDLVCARNTGSSNGGIYVLWNNEDNNFTAVVVGTSTSCGDYNTILVEHDGAIDGGGENFFDTWDNYGNRYFQRKDVINITVNSLAIADYTNDGDNDLAMGKDSGNVITIYHEDPTFVLVNEKIYNAGGYSAWADYDKDGDVDLLVGSFGGANKVYRSLRADNPGGKKQNTQPNEPASGLGYSIYESSGYFQFNWDPGSDSETSVDPLMYEVRIGTVSGKGTIVNPILASPLVGNYYKPRLSSTQLGVEIHPPVENVTYYTSVRTIDTGLKRSVWSVEQSSKINICPGYITDIQTTKDPSDREHKLKVTWSAPGDDGYHGNANNYVIKIATYTINTWAKVNAAQSVPSYQIPTPPATHGALEQTTITGLLAYTSYYMAIYGVDEVGNKGLFSMTFGNTVDISSPTIKDYQPGETQWRSTNPGSIYNVQFFDEGAGLQNVDYCAWSGPAQSGNNPIPWSAVSTPGLTAGDTFYTNPWGVGFNQLKNNSVNYISVRLIDVLGHFKTYNDVFTVYKDTTPPTSNITSIVGTYQDYIDTINGTSNDNYSTVDKVKIRIYDETAIKYWDGGGWIDPSSWTVVSGTGTWSYPIVNTAWTNEHTYKLNSIGIDKVNNQQTVFSTTTFIFDDEDPACYIYQSSRTQISNLTIVSGTANDNISGIFKVELEIKRLDNNQYWYNYGWDAGANQLKCNNTGNWFLTTSTVTWENNIQYQLRVYVTDGAGNLQSSTTHQFYCDQTPPTVFITKPAVTRRSELLTISGTAYDGSYGGIEKVSLRIYSFTDTAYWDGGNFTIDEADRETAWFTVISTMPSYYIWHSTFTDWQNNWQYRIEARSQDKGGMFSTIFSTRTFTYDTDKPQSRVLSPVNNTFIRGITTISGTATDFGSGSVTQPKVGIRRNSDKYWWNGASFSTTTVQWKNTVGTPTNWYYLNLTTAALTYGVSYYITSQAFDNAVPPNPETPYHVRSSTITFDDIAPIADINIPIDSGYIKSLPTLSGDFSDTAPGQVQAVHVIIKHIGGSYFNGTNFSSANPVLLPVQMYASSWTYANAGLTFSSDNKYLIIARSSDTAGNMQNVFTVGVSSNTFTYDTEGPDSGVTYPVENASYNEAALSDLEGTAVDVGVFPSGVNNVELRLSYIYGGDTYYSNGGANYSSTTAPTAAFFSAADTNPWSLDPTIITWVNNSDYYLEARATDTATLGDGSGSGNQGAVCTRRHFKIDDSTPSCHINYPYINNLTGLTTISGSAADSFSGVTAAEVKIQRTGGTYGDNKYWKPGTGWDTNETWILATVSGGNLWYYDTTAVTFNDNTQYEFTARVYDAAGNESADYSNFSLVIDTTTPAVGITKPINNGYYNSTTQPLVTISGGAVDPGSLGSGVAEIRLYIMNLTANPDQYFNGDAFTTTISSVVAVSSPTWYYTDPQLVFSDDTQYQIIAKAKDLMNQWSIVYATSTFIYDITEPASGLIAPNTYFYNSLTVITGTAADVDAGNGNMSGVDSVVVGIEEIGGSWWNTVDAFDAAPQTTDYAVYNADQWYINAASVTWETGKSYRVYADAHDRADNFQVNVTSWTFMYDAPNSTPSISLAFPVDSESYNAVNLSNFAGTSQDNESGVDKVELILKDTILNQYWDGAAGWISQGNANWNSWRVAAGTATWTKVPPALSDNTQYMIWTRAIDNAGNISAGQYTDSDLANEIGGIVFTYDNQNPTSVILHPLIPTNNRNTLVTISGTASDNSATASGIKSIKVTLKKSNNQYWTGAAWGSETDFSATGEEPWYITSISTNIYQDNEQYTLACKVEDYANNNAMVTYSTFTFDTSSPSVGIVSPINNDYVQNIAGVSGTSFDPNTFSSTVDAVYVSIKQISNARYWDGSDFTTASTQYWNVASGTGSWTYNWGAGNLTSSDSYDISVKARDNAGNYSTIWTTHSIIVDYNKPSAITNMPNLASYMYLTQITGTAFDASPSNFVGVELNIWDVNISSGYNGSSWVNNRVWISSDNISINASTWTYTIPDGNIWTKDHQYQISARAMDLADNYTHSITTRTFDYTEPAAISVITTPPPGAPHSKAVNFDEISGTSQDCRATNSIEVRIERQSDYKDWRNDTEIWVSSPYWNTGINSNNSWTFNVSTKGWSTDTEYICISKGIAPSATEENSGLGNVIDSRHIYIDDTPPTVSVTLPVNTSYYYTLTTLSGTAEDTGLGALDTVFFNVKRNTDNKYWNTATSTFSSNTPIDLSAANSGGNIWIYSDADFFADAPWINNDSYVVSITAVDQAGNISATDDNQFSFDNEDPSSAMTEPTNGQYFSDIEPLVTLSGTFSDNFAGTKNVYLKMVDEHGASFNGTNFSGSSPVNTTIFVSSWVYSNANLTSSIEHGAYDIYIYAEDYADNVEPAGTAYTIYYDTALPTSLATYPIHDSSINTAPTITGTADDADSGTATVQVSVRLDNAAYSGTGGAEDFAWNGSTWVAWSGDIWLTAASVDPWSYVVDVSSWQFGKHYWIKSKAIDYVGNIEIPVGDGTHFTLTKPADHLAVTITSDLTAGGAGTVIVEAKDADNDRAIGYMGTITFTTGSGPEGPGNGLPNNYSFQINDEGYKEFTNELTLIRANNGRMVTATDVGTPSITGFSNGVKVSSAAVSRIIALVDGETFDPNSVNGKQNIPDVQYAGVSLPITVYATDAYYNIVNSTNAPYTGITSDTHDAEPGLRNFTSGSDMFNHTFYTAGSQTISFSAVLNSAATNYATPFITVNSSSPVKLQVILPGQNEEPGLVGSLTGLTGSPAPEYAGQFFNATVLLVDNYWNLSMADTPQVKLITSDAFDNASEPVGSIVSGKVVLPITCVTSSSVTVTAVDNDGIGIMYAQYVSTWVWVAPDTIEKLQVLVPGETAVPGSSIGKDGTPTTRTAGVSFPVTVRSVDDYWNLKTSGNQTIHLTTTDSYDTEPSDLILQSGTTVFMATLITGGNHTISVSDMSSALDPDTSPLISVVPNGATRLQLLLPNQTAAPGYVANKGKTGSIISHVSGVPFTVTVNAVDNYYNVQTASIPLVNVTTSDPYYPGPAAVNLIAGTKEISLTFVSEGTYTVKVSTAAGTYLVSDSTGVLITDGIPPAAITNLSALTSTKEVEQIDLAWTAPGDDGTDGMATTYEIHFATYSFGNTQFSTIPGVRVIPVTKSAHLTETYTVTGLEQGEQYYFAIKTYDDNSQLSSIDTKTAGGSATQAKAIAAIKTWKGTISQDWHNPSNWTPYGVPLSTHPVDIPSAANTPVINSPAFAEDTLVINGGLLTVNSNLTLSATSNPSIEVESGGTLAVNNSTITVQGGFLNNGTFTTVNALLKFNGAGIQTFDSTTADSIFAAKGTLKLITQPIITGDFIMASGTVLDLGNETLFLDGSWLNAGGTVTTLGSSQIAFTGGTNEILRGSHGAGAVQLYMSKGAAALTIDSGTQLNSNTVAINTGNLIIGNGTTHTVNGSINIYSNGKLTVNNASTQLNVTANVTVNSGGTLTVGTLGQMNVSGTVAVGGTFQFNSSSGTLKVDTALNIQNSGIIKSGDKTNKITSSNPGTTQYVFTIGVSTVNITGLTVEAVNTSGVVIADNATILNLNNIKFQAFQNGATALTLNESDTTTNYTFDGLNFVDASLATLTRSIYIPNLLNPGHVELINFGGGSSAQSKSQANAGVLTWKAETYPPDPINTLVVSSSTVNHGAIKLQFTAVSDNPFGGDAYLYQVKYLTTDVSQAPYNDDTTAWWNAATAMTGEPTPSTSGTLESFEVTGLTSWVTYYFAIKAEDSSSNISVFSNSNATPGARPADRIAPSANTGITGVYYSNSTLDTITGTSSDATAPISGVKQVRVRIRDANDLYWDGAAGFNGTPSEYTATGTTAWSLAVDTHTWQENKLYRVYTRALDNAGNASNFPGSPSFTYEYDTTPPAAVNDLSVYASGASGEVTLKFTVPQEDGSTTSTLIDYFIVSYKQGVDFSSTTYAIAVKVNVDNPGWDAGYKDAAGITIDGLTDEVTYYFHIKSVDISGNTSDLDTGSNIWANPGDLTPPEPISDLTLTMGSTAGTVKLSWTVPHEDDTQGGAPESYTISYATFTLGYTNFYKGKIVNVLNGSSAVGDTMSATITGLINGMVYYFRIRSSDDQGNLSDLDTGPTAKTDEGDKNPPATITDLKARTPSSGGGEIDLSWTVPGEDGTSGGAPVLYDVRYSTTSFDEKGYYSLTAHEISNGAYLPGQTFSTRISDLTPAERYYFRVTSVDDMGNISAVSYVASALASYTTETDISGSVTQADGTGITGAVITISKNGATVTTATTFNGVYRAVGLSAGQTYRVQVTWTVEGVTSSVYVDSILAGTGSVDFTLEIQYTLAAIEGQVLGARMVSRKNAPRGVYQAPGGDAESFIELKQNNITVVKVYTELDGKYVIPNLLPGDYTAIAFNGLSYSLPKNISLHEGDRLSLLFEFLLLQEKDVYNFPNPCRHQTTIRFITGSVTIDAQIQIFTIAGEIVREIKGSDLSLAGAGEYQYVWDLTNMNGESVSSGVYIFMVKVKDTMTNDTAMVIKKLAIIR